MLKLDEKIREINEICDQMKIENNTMLIKMEDLVTNLQLDEVKKIIKSKIDWADINKLFEDKSNKFDGKKVIKAIEILRNQMEYMCLTDISILKSIVNISDNKFDSARSKENKQ